MDFPRKPTLADILDNPMIALKIWKLLPSKDILRNCSLVSRKFCEQTRDFLHKYRVCHLKIRNPNPCQHLRMIDNILANSWTVLPFNGIQPEYSLARSWKHKEDYCVHTVGHGTFCCRSLHCFPNEVIPTRWSCDGDHPKGEAAKDFDCQPDVLFPVLSKLRLKYFCINIPSRYTCPISYSFLQWMLHDHAPSLEMIDLIQPSKILSFSDAQEYFRPDLVIPKLPKLKSVRAMESHNGRYFNRGSLEVNVIITLRDIVEMSPNLRSIQGLCCFDCRMFFPDHREEVRLWPTFPQNFFQLLSGACLYTKAHSASEMQQIAAGAVRIERLQFTLPSALDQPSSVAFRTILDNSRFSLTLLDFTIQGIMYLYTIPHLQPFPNVTHILVDFSNDIGQDAADLNWVDLGQLFPKLKRVVLKAHSNFKPTADSMEPHRPSPALMPLKPSLMSTCGATELVYKLKTFPDILLPKALNDVLFMPFPFVTRFDTCLRCWKQLYDVGITLPWELKVLSLEGVPVPRDLSPASPGHCNWESKLLRPVQKGLHQLNLFVYHSVLCMTGDSCELCKPPFVRPDSAKIFTVPEARLLCQKYPNIVVNIKESTMEYVDKNFNVEALSFDELAPYLEDLQYLEEKRCYQLKFSSHERVCANDN